MKVSEANTSDIPQLCDLLDLLFTQEAEIQPDRSLQKVGLQRILDAPEIGRILVLRKDDSIIGMVNVLFTISTALGSTVALIEDMVVHPEYRGCGAGTALLQAAIHLATAFGCRRITLLTDRTNVFAQKFYERHGFVLSEMVPMRLAIGRAG